MTKYRWTLVPVIEPLDPRRMNVYEHPPADYCRYGEFPRYIVPPGGHAPPITAWKLVAMDNKP